MRFNVIEVLYVKYFLVYDASAVDATVEIRRTLVGEALAAWVGKNTGGPL